jgi:polar amino acid transport system substrate-binding protein
LFVLIFSSAAFAAEFIAMTGPLPPYSINKGLHLKGISVDTLVMIMSLSGFPMETDDVKLMLWSHAFKKTQAGPKRIMLNVPKSVRYEKTFKWVGPIHVSKYVLIGRKGKKVSLSSPTSLDAFKIATIRRSAPEKVLLKEGVSKSAIVSSSMHVSALRQLNNKQVDFFAYGNYSAAYLMKGMGMNLQNFKVYYTIKEVPLYYAFSRDTSDELIHRLNENLKTMKIPGPDGRSRFDKIVGKYLPDGAIR